MGCTQSTPTNTPNQQQRQSAAPPAGNNGAKNVKDMKTNPLSEVEILSRIDAPKESKNLEIEGVKMRYAYMSQRGYYPESLDKDNQDAFLIVSHFGAPSENQAFFAIFDGHGKDGHHCARFARDHVRHDLLFLHMI